MKQESMQKLKDWWKIRVHKEEGRRGEKLSDLTLDRYLKILRDFPDFEITETTDANSMRLWIIGQLNQWEANTGRKLYAQVIFAVRTYLRMLEETDPVLAPTIKNIRTNVNIPYKDIIKSASMNRRYFVEKTLSKEAIREIIIFIKQFNEIIANIIQISYDTGCRVSELASIERGDITTSERKILIKKGKGGYLRIVNYEKSSDEVISNLWGNPTDMLIPYATETIKKKFKLYVRRYAKSKLETANIRDKEKIRKLARVSMHWLRHSRATHLAIVWKDIARLRNYMGWQSIRMADIYVSYSTDLFNYKSTNLWED